MKELEQSRIFYEDYAKIWCNPKQLYYSQSSHYILSKFHTEIVEEIVSYYCPQCLSRFQDEELMGKYSKNSSDSSHHQASKPHGNIKGYCPKCYQCPDCKGVMLKFEQQKGEALDDKTMFLCTCCQQTHFVSFSDISHHNGIQEKYFQKLVKFYSENTADGVKQKSQQQSKINRLESWHIEDVEKSLLQKHNKNDNFSVFDFDPEAEKLPIIPFRPQHFLLKNKRTLRSRKDLETGKMNILIQQRLLPLDGDSSMKLNKGKWWLKDSSAVHVLPFLQILKLSKSSSEAYLILKITNPNESQAKLKFTALQRGDASPMDQKTSSHNAADANNIPRQKHLVLNETGKYEYQLIGNEWKIFGENDLIGANEYSLDSHEDELLKDDFSSEPTDFHSILAVFDQQRKDSIYGLPRGNVLFLGLPVVSTVELSSAPASVSDELYFALQWTFGTTTIPLKVMIRF